MKCFVPPFNCLLRASGRREAFSSAVREAVEARCPRTKAAASDLLASVNLLVGLMERHPKRRVFCIPLRTTASFHSSFKKRVERSPTPCIIYTAVSTEEAEDTFFKVEGMRVKKAHRCH